MKKIAAIAILIGTLPASVFAQSAASVQSASITLSSAQTQSLKGSPVTLVAAPGAGNCLSVLSAVLQYKAGSAPYAVSGGGHFSLLFGSAPGASGPVESSDLSATGFIDQAQNQIRIPRLSAMANAQSGVENAALAISNDGDAEWSAGNGTVTITVYYTVVALQ